MKKSLLILLFCAVAVGISAQDEKPSDKAFLMFLHGGYCYAPNLRGDGLTSPSADYAKKLSSGGSWNAQAYFRTKMFIVGLMYSGFTTSGSYVASLEESQNQLTSSDKLLTTYIAPQLGMNIPVKSFDIGWNLGLGGMWLKNNGTVFEKPRILKGSTIGANLNVRGVYNFTKNLGLSMEVMGVAASIGSARVNYHDQNLKVEYFPLMPLYQFSFSLGLKCSF